MARPHRRLLGAASRLQAVACGVVLTACATQPAPLLPSVAASPDAPSNVQPPKQRVVETSSPSKAFTDPRRKQLLMAALPAIDAQVAAMVQQKKIPALAIGVVIDGELALARGYGTRHGGGGAVDEHTVFRIGSISKVLTGMAVMQLRDEGKIALDAPIEHYISEAAGLVYPQADAPRVRVRHLLTHSSGLASMAAGHGVKTREVLALLDGLALDFVPGTAMSYSNFGAGLAGVLVAEVAEVPLRDHISREILAPLGMKATVWDVERVAPDSLATGHGRDGKPIPATKHWRLGAIEGAGGLYSNVHDMARFAAFHLSAWPSRSGPDDGLLRRSTVRETHQMMRFGDLGVRVEPREQTPPSEPDDASGSAADKAAPKVHGRAAGVGAFWQIEQNCEWEHVVWHNGGTEGYRAAIHLLPKRGVAVIALTSSKFSLDKLARRALSILRESGGLEPRRPVIPPPVLAIAKRVASMVSKPALVARAGYESLLAEGFRKHVSFEDFAKLNQTLYDEVGACRVNHTTGATAASATVVLVCDKGHVVLKLFLSKRDPTQLDGAGFSSGKPNTTRCRVSSPAKHK